MDNFTRAFLLVVGIEAGLSMDPEDPGNWTGGTQGVGVLKGTKYGISAKAYPNLDIANLTLDDAEAIYRRDYWGAVSGDALPWVFALLTFDCAVNQGQPTARVTLQQALGVAVDGNIGPVTLAAARKATTWHAARLMTLRMRRYMTLPGWAHDGDGWMNRCFLICLNQSQTPQG
ncbi:glycosyl hydrolase 108 family protein [Paraburkholderia phymatum]|uniref:TtsA-like Glycoside hydrolase family 108 domain-containing protein n=1 Tax=Paraburkholderia phymatum (strain DSM 17167 / CIP 108236 / LMG 21445 / STM815) TaxID=391038 RepID=B2JUJ3_PARP8|nr:glycosyl hydrolase 108 family protein [Paraburkholderia phymatum]ACC76164.1 protein of unknown function DUF847 [Paraburkholderia phymatum STM815]